MPNNTALSHYEAVFNLIPGSSSETIAMHLTMADWDALADDLALELGSLIRQGASLETMRKYAARIGDCERRIVCV